MQPLKNTGVVVYSKGSEPGTLNAKWYHSDSGGGTGYATGTESTDFEGDYTIQYFDHLGRLQAIRRLEIKKYQSTYQVFWFEQDKITSSGLGLKTTFDGEEILSVGYRDV